MCKIGFKIASADNRYLVRPESLEHFLEAMKYQNASEAMFRVHLVKKSMSRLSDEELDAIRGIARSLLARN